MLNEDAVHQILARVIAGLRRPHPIRVAIDGIDAAGKTTLADALAPRVGARGRPVIRASVDGFHHPRAARYRRGADSPDGFYLDSYDHERLRAVLLDPLGPAGDRRHRTAVFDWRIDAAVDLPEATADESAVLLFDGIFCQHPAIADCWDLVVFLAIDFEEALRRMQIRDRSPSSPEEAMTERFWKRYAPGQQRYLREVRPRDNADIVIDNTDPMHPVILRGARSAGD